MSLVGSIPIHSRFRKFRHFRGLRLPSLRRHRWPALPVCPHAPVAYRHDSGKNPVHGLRSLFGPRRPPSRWPVRPPVRHGGGGEELTWSPARPPARRAPPRRAPPRRAAGSGSASAGSGSGALACACFFASFSLKTSAVACMATFACGTTSAASSSSRSRVFLECSWTAAAARLWRSSAHSARPRSAWRRSLAVSRSASAASRAAIRVWPSSRRASPSRLLQSLDPDCSSAAVRAFVAAAAASLAAALACFACSSAFVAALSSKVSARIVRSSAGSAAGSARWKASPTIVMASSRVIRSPFRYKKHVQIHIVQGAPVAWDRCGGSPR